MSKVNCIIWLIRITAAAVTLFVASACDSREKVVGHWQCSLLDSKMTDSVADDIITSIVISGDGRVLLTSDVSLTRPLSDTSNIFADSVAVRAVAGIEGRWSYVSHKSDEISIVFDRSTFGVSIDPEDISYSPAPINRRVAMTHDGMKEATIEEYRLRLGPVMQSHFDEFARIERISVESGEMHCRTVCNAYVMTAL